MKETLKYNPDDENEIHDLTSVRTGEDRCHVIPVAKFPPEVALAVVEALSNVVKQAHQSPEALKPDEDGIVRAQTFEEGDVYMLATPFPGYFANRYLMDFYDVARRGMCSRMHLHTGLRFVRMMTGPGTRIRVSSLTSFVITDVEGVTPFQPQTFVDDLPDTPPGDPRARYNLVVAENSWVDMQIPRGVSHQFNAVGPHAVIDSVHPEESIEVFRERMSGYKMLAQTIFLGSERPPSATCVELPEEGSG